MKDESYQYYAFISYSHKDQKWAEWIQRAIEHYKLPAIIRRESQKPLPRRIAPVFRDATDLGVDVLVDGLHEELEKSRFLIVVCSPNSAKPNAEGKHFVDEEVRHFCELGRTKQIIPVIIEGAPEESFGPVLKSKEILALDATKQPKERILNDIVAKILGLKPDALWRRAERERRKQRIIRLILCGVMVFFAAFAGYFAWDANRTVENYYADYVDSFGLPEGIFQLKKSELKGRYIHYRFEYKGFQYGKSPHADSADWCIWNLLGVRRRLIRVVQANSHGYPRKSEHSERFDRPIVADFKYDKDLRLREIRCGHFNDERGALHPEKRIELFTESGVTNGLVKFFSGESQLAVNYMSHKSRYLNYNTVEGGHAEVAMHLLSRDSKGRVTQRLYLNLVGVNIAGIDGQCGNSYDYDKIGRIMLMRNLFRSGLGVCHREDRHGVAGCRYTYAGSNLAKTEYLDGKGNPTMGHQGWMTCISHFDRWGNPVAEDFVDEHNILMLTRDGFSRATGEYDEYGNLSHIAYYDRTGNLTLSQNGWAQLRRKYDEVGRLVEESYWGKDDKLTRVKEGYAACKFRYDQHGNITELSYWDCDGNQVLTGDGYSRVRQYFDDDKNITQQLFLDCENKPTMVKDGYASICFEYDKRGNLAKASYMGQDGKRVDTKYGYSAVGYEYDLRCNIRKEMFMGVDDAQRNNILGYAVRESIYDGQGNEIERCFWDGNGGLAVHKDGIAGWKSRYDDYGNEIERSFFSTDKKPCKNILGFAGWKHLFDDFGNVTNEIFYGINGEPVVNSRGFSEMRVRYDINGREIRREYLDERGAPKLNSEGFAAFEVEYNHCGYITKRLYLGVDGQRTTTKYGIAEIRQENDHLGNMTHICYFDAEGNPVCNIQGFAGMSKKYDATGNLLRECYLGTDGHLVANMFGIAQTEFSYDSCGNKIKEAYLDVLGLPTCNKDGVSVYTFQYDHFGTLLRSCRYDVEGREMPSCTICASMEIFEQSNAEKLGVKVGDIWCRFGTYDLQQNTLPRKLLEEIRLNRNKEKRLIVARREGITFTIHQFDFPIGPMGVRLGDGNITTAEMEELLKVLDSYYKTIPKEQVDRH